MREQDSSEQGSEQAINPVFTGTIDEFEVLRGSSTRDSGFYQRVQTWLEAARRQVEVMQQTLTEKGNVYQDGENSYKYGLDDEIGTLKMKISGAEDMTCHLVERHEEFGDLDSRILSVLTEEERKAVLNPNSATADIIESSHVGRTLGEYQGLSLLNNRESYALYYFLDKMRGKPEMAVYAAYDALFGTPQRDVHPLDEIPQLLQAVKRGRAMEEVVERAPKESVEKFHRSLHDLRETIKNGNVIDAARQAREILAETPKQIREALIGTTIGANILERLVRLYPEARGR